MTLFTMFFSAEKKWPRLSMMNQVGIEKLENGTKSPHFGSHQNREDPKSDLPRSLA